MAIVQGLTLRALPILLTTGAAFSFGLASILTKRYGPFNALTLTGWSALFAAPPIMLISLVCEHRQAASLWAADADGWLALGYTVLIGGGVAFGLWFWLVASCRMSRVAPFALLLPPFGVAFTILFLKEQLNYALAAGGLLAFAGVAICQVGQGVPAARASMKES